MIGSRGFDSYRSRFQMLQEALRNAAIGLDARPAVALLDQKCFEPQEPWFSFGNIMPRGRSHARIYENERKLGLKLCERKTTDVSSECVAQEFAPHMRLLRISFQLRLHELRRRGKRNLRRWLHVDPSGEHPT